MTVVAAPQTRATPSSSSPPATIQRKASGAPSGAGLRGATFDEGLAMLAPPSEGARGKGGGAGAGAAAKQEVAKDAPPVAPEKAAAAAKKSGGGGGSRLPDHVRERFEQAFGADFSMVRIHQGSARAQAVKAHAYAEGFDLHFAPGMYAPESKSGAELLGHELAHVVQQQSGRVQAPQGKGSPLVQDRGLEAEADAAGARAARGESAGIATGGKTIAAPAVQGYFTLNQEQMQALWLREQDKDDGERAEFHGQETGSDLAHPNSFTDAQARTNLVTKQQVPALRVSEDANMAIEDADFASRQAKNVFLASGLIGQSNAHLKATRSRFRLRQSGNGLSVPGANGLKDLVSVVAQSATNPQEMGDTLTTPMNCNEMGGAVSGGEVNLDMNLTTRGEGPKVDKQDKAIRVAQYINSYSEKNRKNRNKHRAFRKKGKKLDSHLEKEAQKSTEFAYPEPQDQEWLKPMREFTVNNAQQFKTELIKTLGTNMLIWEERPEDGYFKVMVNEDDQLAVFEQNPLAAFITDTVVLPPFKDVKVGKSNKTEKVRLLEQKQEQIAGTYGGLPQNELDDTSERLGVNEFIEPEVGDALEILPVGVPDQNKEITDHRKPMVDNGNGPEKQKISALFPYHWGGVVARSGPDYVTFENYARNEEDGNKAAPGDETRSYFQMYGSKRALNPQTQSFHEFWGRYFANPLTINHSNNKKREVRGEEQNDQPEVRAPNTGGQLQLGGEELDLGINPQMQDRIQALDDGLQGHNHDVVQVDQQRGQKKIRHGAPQLTNEEQARVQRVKNFLATLSNIRIGFDKSPNFGHQSATVATMEAIRDLGYAGWFEIIYEPENAPKIHTLMPGDFDKDGPATQVVPAKKLKFIGVGNNEAPKQTGGVGIFGANDHGHSGERLNVDHALTLQPFEWHQSRKVESYGQERLLEPERQTEQDKRKSPMAFQYDVNSSDDTAGLVDQNLPNNATLATNVKALLAATQAGTIDMQAIYGLSDVEAELAALVDGVRWAQNNGPTNVKCGAVALAMIPGVSDGMVPQNVTIIDLAAQGADQTINGLGGTDIAVVKTGRMPQPLFRELYRASTLPPVLEGANTTNFMRLTGLPYLNFFTLKTPYVAPFGGDTDIDYQPVLDMLALAETTTRTKSPGRAEAVGKVMQAAKDPNSLLVDFFAKGGEETRGAGANMVVIGLDELRKEMTKEPPPLEMLTNKGGRTRVSASIAQAVVQRNQDLVGKDADVETVVKHMVHESRATRKNDEALSKTAQSSLKAVSKALGKAGVQVGDLGDPEALRTLIGDVTDLRDVWAQRKGGKATTKKLTACVGALTALAQNAPTDAPSPDKNPRAYAEWLATRPPFNGHMPLPGVFPNAVHQAAVRLVPPPVVQGGGDDGEDDGTSSTSED